MMSGATKGAERDGRKLFEEVQTAARKLRKKVRLSREDWDDVVINATLSLSQRRAALADVVDPSAYIYAAVRNKAVRMAKANQKRKAVEQARGSHGGTTAAAAIDREERQRLADAMSGLNKDDQALLDQVSRGVSYREIARERGMSAAGAWAAVKGARERLAETAFLQLKQPERREVMEQILRALAVLDPPDVEVIRLRTIEGLSFPEMSRSLGKPVSTLQDQYASAIKRLQRRLQKVDSAALRALRVA